MQAWQTKRLGSFAGLFVDVWFVLWDSDVVGFSLVSYLVSGLHVW